ncbi:MAG TPA: kelch repeat-containing protein [Candidatus Dormibacteraeota bacterium]|nr:kelch repeat-containing protein [Candidatus Dormibacteraeota bacterium]
MSTELQRTRWSRPLAGILFVAVVGAGLGAYFGIRAVQGAGSGSPAGQPAARSGAAMAYDPANGTVVLFGGQTTSRALNDTWTWDGSGWTQAHPATSPPPMDGAQMTYDPVTHDVLLVGAQQVEASNHAPIACWGGSGSSSSGSSGSGSSGSRTILIPPVHAASAGTPAPIASGASRTPTPTAPPGCGSIFSPIAATWLWNGSGWSKAPAATPFVVFGSGSLATDPVSDRAVLLTRGPFAEPALGAVQPAIACSIPNAAMPGTHPSCPLPVPVAPAWMWNGHQWKVMASSSNTSSFDLVGSSIVEDAVSGQLATFGSNFIAPIPQPLPCIGCVKGVPVPQTACCTGTESLWNGTAWKQVATYKNGPPTPGVTFIGDRSAHSDVLLTGDGQTWIWTGVWTRVHPGTTPPIASGAASAFDASTGQVVIFGGFGTTSHATGMYDQTWTWDGSNWTRRGGSAGPSVTVPVPSPISVPPGLPCKPIMEPAQPAGATAVPQPPMVCNAVSGSSGSSGGASGVNAAGGVVAP